MPLSGTYIRREQIKVEITRLNKKFKDKYRFKARAFAPLGYVPNEEVDHKRLLMGSYVYSKTEHGARVSAIHNLLQKCRPALTKEQQKINSQSRKLGFVEPVERRVYVEVRISNSLDFIMNDDDGIVWHEIKRVARWLP